MDPRSGFTPYRRRDQGQLGISPVASGQVPWITARCNRLLRPISSRIALLRKHKQHCIEQGLSLPQNKLLSSSRLVSNDAPNRCRLVCENLAKPDSDPDWAPEDRPRKRLRRTYSSRSGLQSSRQMEPDFHTQKAMAPAEITIQQPLIGTNELPLEQSAVLDFANGERPPGSVSDTKDPQSFTRESFRKLAKSISPSEWMLIDGLYNGLEALLKATTINRPPSNIGARSLFSSCLRKIPDHILEEQRKVEAEDPDTDCNIASIIYEDLESYSSSVLEGWKPLKEIVRAHGIAILATAIKDGSIGASIARGLVVLCVQGSANMEAQILLASLAEISKPIPKPKLLSERLFEKSIYLHTLNDFSSRSGHYSFFYHQLSTMLSNGTIPIEWISSIDMVECWNGAIGHIIEGGSRSKEAHLLLKTAVSVTYTTTLDPISCKIHSLRCRIRDARALRAKQPTTKKAFKCNFSTGSRIQDEKTNASITSTIVNLMTVLLSISLVRSDVSDQESISSCSVSSTSIETLALEALQSHQVSLYESTCFPLSNTQAALISMPLFAFRLENSYSNNTESNEAQLNAFWLDIVTDSGRKAFLSERLSSLLCDVARCCDKAGPKKGFEYLQRIIRPLLDPLKSRNASPAIRLFICRIAKQAAFEFAEGTSQREHLDWALEMEDIVNCEFTESDQPNQGRTPARVSAFPTIGFRWEEGIGEWVAKTPATLIQKAKPISGGSGQCTSDEEHENAIEEGSSRATPPTCLRLSDLSPYAVCKRSWTGVPRRTSGYNRKARSNSSNSECSEHIVQDGSLTHRHMKPPGRKASNLRTSQLRSKSDDEADELSTPESSQEQTWLGNRTALGEIRNLGRIKLRPRGVGKLRAKSLNGLPLLARRGRRSSIFGLEAGEDGSEDELGI